MSDDILSLAHAALEDDRSAIPWADRLPADGHYDKMVTREPALAREVIRLQAVLELVSAERDALRAELVTAREANPQEPTVVNIRMTNGTINLIQETR